MTHKKENSLLNNQEGFTLIEIIAVLVILGILSVVAVPKYFNLQQQAEAKAMQAAMAEAVGRVNGYFAQQLLSDVAPDEIVYDTVANPNGVGTDLGDFTLGITQSGEELTLTVSANDDTAVQNADDVIRVIDLPGLPSGESSE